MKKKFTDYIVFIVIGVLVILFIVLALLFKKDEFEINRSIDKWLEDTKKEEYVVTVVAQSFCGACKALKPYMQKAYNEKNFNIYWFEVDILGDDAYKTITETYDLASHNYKETTPYTFITYNGEFVDYYDGTPEEEKPIFDLLEKYDII